MSGVGFEPTPSIEDQKSHLIPYQGTRPCLESGALDHSANLTYMLTLGEKGRRDEYYAVASCMLEQVKVTINRGFTFLTGHLSMMK